MDILFEFESILNSENVFISGITGEPSHRSAYMTIMNFEKMDSVLKENKNRYSKNEWMDLKKDFEDLSYLSPINSLVAYKIGEKFGI